MTANPFSAPQSQVAEVSYVDGMRVEYDLRFSDVVLFTGIHQFLSPVLQVAYIGLAVFIGQADGENASDALLHATLWYAGLWFFQFFFNIFYLISGKNRTQLTQHAIVVSDASLFEETRFNASHFFWPGVLKVVSRPGFVALYVAQHHAHVIPNRAFASEQQRTKFMQVVREKIDAAAQ